MKKFFLILPASIILISCTTPRNLERHPSSNPMDPSSTQVCPFDTKDPQWKSHLLIHHFYVGQGNSAFIRTPSGTTVLIDAGLQGQGTATILPVLKACGFYGVDYAVLTHPHVDHFGGYEDLFKAGFKVNVAFYLPSYVDSIGPNSIGDWLGFKLIADGGVTSEGTSIPGYLGSLGAKHSRIPLLDNKQIVDRAVDPNQRVDFNIVAADAHVQNGTPTGAQVRSAFSDPDSEKPTTKDNNALSISMMISYQKFSYFIGGDLTGGGEGKKKDKPDVESEVAKVVHQIDVYHADHHGSDTSNNAAILTALKPTSVIVSVGLGGSNGDNSKQSPQGYHLPDYAAILRMIQVGQVSQIFMTSRGETMTQDYKTAINVATDPVTSSHVVDMNGSVTLLSDGQTYEISGETTKPGEYKFNARGNK